MNMPKKIVQTVSVSLDETQERRLLRHALYAARLRLKRHIDLREHILAQIAEFEAQYREKIQSLTAILEQLNRALFKYRSIGENLDAHFSFDEAERVFEEALRNREQDIAEAYARARLEPSAGNPPLLLTAQQQKELKGLYRVLARKHHPDMPGGNAVIMMRINAAYAHGDLETLRDIEREHPGDDAGITSAETLRSQLSDALDMIRRIKTEILGLRKSEMYRLRRDLLKNHPSIAEGLDDLTKTMRREISIRKHQVQKMKESLDQLS